MKKGILDPLPPPSENFIKKVNEEVRKRQYLMNEASNRKNKGGLLSRTFKVA